MVTIGKHKKLDGLYLVTDRSLSLGRPLTEIVAAAARGGVNIVQLREKNADSREFVELARTLKSLLTPFEIPFIINDRADIAMIVGADGLHIGQRDIAFADARRLLGPEAIIGISIENERQAQEMLGSNIDYIAISPVFSTPTKTNTAPALGIEGMQKIKKLVPLPIVAIGGINEENISVVRAAGADMIAVVSAICSAEDPEKATRDLVRSMQNET